MYVGGNTDNTEKAIGLLDNLEAADRMGFLAIFFEHFYEGLIHEGNYDSRHEAERHDAKILEPGDCGLYNAGDIARAFLALYSTLVEPVMNPFPDIVEASIKRTPKINAALSAFYKLRFPEQIDYVAEVFVGIGCGGLLRDIELSEDALGIGFDQSYATKAAKVKFGFNEYETDIGEIPF